MRIQALLFLNVNSEHLLLEHLRIEVNRVDWHRELRCVHCFLDERGNLIAHDGEQFVQVELDRQLHLLADENHEVGVRVQPQDCLLWINLHQNMLDIDGEEIVDDVEAQRPDCVEADAAGVEVERAFVGQDWWYRDELILEAASEVNLVKVDLLNSVLVLCTQE